MRLEKPLEMEKKSIKKAPVKKDEGPEKEGPKKPAAHKASAHKAHSKPRKPEVEGVAKAAAEVRVKQEEGSIAPESSRLVSAFDLFKKKRVSTSAPAVTRLAPGSSLPRPSLPKPPEPAAPPVPAPAPKPEVSAPAPAPMPAPAVKLPTAVPPPVKSSVKPSAAAPAPAKPSSPPPSGRFAAPSRPNFPPRPGPRPGQFHHRPSGPKPHHKPKPAPSASAQAETSASKSSLKKIRVSSVITVRELSEKMEVRTNDVIKKLMGLGIFATINQRLEPDAAQLVAADFGYELEVVAMYKEEELAVKRSEAEDPTLLKPRPPVVTIMGHVDHGKTSLLDAIRQSRVAEGEAGGITQHIGAYRVKTEKGEVVFLDTPGHAAFTAMRARGAKVTDVVVLVVSATDGVMPQTVEAMDHARAAGVPIVVAVNKIDLPGANPQKIRQDLAQHGLQPEEWGGKNIFVDVSAKKRLNLDKLLESLLLQAEILELKANPDRLAYGAILEARMDARRGAVATVLVQAGTLKVGDSFVAGLTHGKVKALIDDHGARIDSAGPSTPVEVLGLIGAPQAGDAFTVVENERAARDIAEKRRLVHREQTLAHQKHMTLVGLRSALNAGQSKAKELNILLKADVQGSLQALRDSLEGLSTTECRVRIIHAGIGNATESDILLASASDAVTLLFHADADSRAEEVAAREGVELRRYEIIYELIEDVKAALEGLLAPELVDVVIGKGEVKQLFKVKAGVVAGSAVREGKVTRGSFLRVARGGQVVHEGKVTTLKRFKDDVKEVEKGLDCGIGVDGFADFQPGDLLEFYLKETRVRRLSQSPR